MIPDTPDEVTSAWLTRVLREAGVLREARVADVRREVLGEGEGFIGLVLRLHLALDRPQPETPRSLVAKLPTQDPQNRAAGEGLGAYEREIRFYRELAPLAEFRTARCYHGDFEPQPGAHLGPKILRGLDRLPLWAIRLLLPVLGRLGQRPPRRSVLLLEDLAPGRIGDQTAGCSVEEARRALATLARLHAAWWESPRIEDLYWVSHLDVAPRVGRVVFRRGRPAFERLYGPRVSARVRELGDWLDVHGAALVQRLGARPVTLLHGDYRLDNLCFEASGGVVPLDWQGVSRGRGAWDVGYFLSSSFGAELAPSEEVELVRAYHEELCGAGVVGYDLETCLEDYRCGVLLSLQRVMLGADQLDFSGERGRTMIDSWVDRLTARVEHLPLPRLGLSSGPEPGDPT